MARHELLRDGEVPVVSVTPVSHGVLRPLLLTLTTLALIVDGATRFSLVHRYEGWLTLVTVVPFALVTLTRTWRWRSYKVHVTTQRVNLEGGVLRHWRSSVELADVVAIHVDQRVSERLTRRGFVSLETAAGPISLGLVRHPHALARLIDAGRLATNEPYVVSDAAYGDDVEDYDDEPRAYEPDLGPDAWTRRPFE